MLSEELEGKFNCLNKNTEKYITLSDQKNKL